MSVKVLRTSNSHVECEGSFWEGPTQAGETGVRVKRKFSFDRKLWRNGFSREYAVQNGLAKYCYGF